MVPVCGWYVRGMCMRVCVYVRGVCKLCCVYIWVRVFLLMCIISWAESMVMRLRGHAKGHRQLQGRHIKTVSFKLKGFHEVLKYERGLVGKRISRALQRAYSHILAPTGNPCACTLTPCDLPS